MTLLAVATLMSQMTATPSARQLAWHETEAYALVHFGLNTYIDKEWGHGDSDPKLFNPVKFDAEQIVGAAKAGGLRGLVLVAKHHDGFCLWPSPLTKRSVADSPWRNGKGDMVREFQLACAKMDMKFGVYLSPWDASHPEYGRPAYVEYYRAQLADLMTNYGPLFMVWFDGANGGDGYYGGANEKRTIDRATYYGWQETWAMIRKLQPAACMFSDVGPDVRWVGNESGFADETCWATYSPNGLDGQPPVPGMTKYEEGQSGHRDSTNWLPAECDVPLRPGWFWHESQNGQTKTPAQLWDLYCKSVGRGAALDLGLAPDTSGRLTDEDVAALKGLGDRITGTFAKDFAKGARTTRAKTALTHVLNEPALVDLVRVREGIRHGQRVERFRVFVKSGGRWAEVANGTSIGACRILRFPPVLADEVRLELNESSGEPRITEFGVFKQWP